MKNNTTGGFSHRSYKHCGASQLTLWLALSNTPQTNRKYCEDANSLKWQQKKKESDCPTLNVAATFVPFNSSLFERTLPTKRCFPRISFQILLWGFLKAVDKSTEKKRKMSNVLVTVCLVDSNDMYKLLY